ncbi:hypothetical protein BAE44_0003382, partial [Dichanthelium oligosanthes]
LWDLIECPYEINKFHSWIMKAMKLGLKEVTANVPKIVYGHPHKLFIDFEDLHALYRRKTLDMNLISVWCLMQYEDERKMARYKVAYLNPQLINKTAHRFKMLGEVKAKLEEATTQEEKDIIIKQAHRSEKNKVAIYISRVMRHKRKKDYIMAIYGFNDHCILFMIVPKWGFLLVLDSANYPSEEPREVRSLSVMSD